MPLKERFLRYVAIDTGSSEESGQHPSTAKQWELARMLEFVRQGDTVVVEAISRFARNTRDLLELVEQLTIKGVEFVSRKEAIDTTTPSGKFMLTIFGAVAELERAYILERQKEGIAISYDDSFVGKVNAEKVFHHSKRFFTCHNLCIRVRFYEIIYVCRVIRLHMLYDQIVG